MKEKKIVKFENKDRLDELNPIATLARAGFKEGMSLCDLGAGTGVFSFPAAEISSGKIYALDISEMMIEILEERKAERQVDNLIVKRVESDDLPLENDTCDMVTMITVLHEISDKVSMLSEIKRVLRKKGRLMIIEFYNKKTPMGPPVDHRISEEEMVGVCIDSGFTIRDQFPLGDNFYCVVFEQNS